MKAKSASTSTAAPIVTRGWGSRSVAAYGIAVMAARMRCWSRSLTTGPVGSGRVRLGPQIVLEQSLD